MSLEHILAKNNPALKALACNSCAFFSSPVVVQSVTGAYLPNNLVNSVVCMSGAGTTLFLPSSTGLGLFLAATGLVAFGTGTSYSGASFNFDLINAGATGYISNNADANWSLVCPQASTPFTFPAVIPGNSGKKCVVTKTGSSTFQLAVV
jgi:hypothetical protein